MSVVINGGTVIRVNGQPYTLQPTMQAVRRVTASYGGLRPAIARVQAVDFDAAASIIVAGADLPLDKAALDALGAAIWRDQDSTLILSEVMDYLALLLRGGRDPAPGDPPATGE